MEQTLTQANFTTSVRYFLTLGISFAAGRGWIGADTATNAGLLAVAILPMLWAYYANWAKEHSTQGRETVAVQAGMAMAQNGGASTPPASISRSEAQTVIAAYGPTTSGVSP